mmetsp:Transcript_73756/g.117362  ORF Transcript_73756/g.117362 Transcript_73756/m.117362 type:complete len:203 (-) Transcript_73756:1008-1616(-)
MIPAATATVSSHPSHQALTFHNWSQVRGRGGRVDGRDLPSRGPHGAAAPDLWALVGSTCRPRGYTTAIAEIRRGHPHGSHGSHGSMFDISLHRNRHLRSSNPTADFHRRFRELVGNAVKSPRTVCHALHLSPSCPEYDPEGLRDPPPVRTRHLQRWANRCRSQVRSLCDNPAPLHSNPLGSWVATPPSFLLFQQSSGSAQST